MLSERISRSRLAKTALVVGATAAIPVGQLVFGGNRLDDKTGYGAKTQAPGQNPDTSPGLEYYDANCGVISPEGTTVTPVVRTVRGKQELFRIIGHGLKIRLERIEHPTARVHEQWADDPDVTVVSNEGFIRTDTVDGTPVVDVELSNHIHETRAIGQTSPTTAHDLNNTGC